MFDREMCWDIFSKLPLDVQKDVIHTYVLMALKNIVSDFFGESEDNTNSVKE